MKNCTHSQSAIKVARHVALSLTLGASAVAASALEMAGVHYTEAAQVGSRSLQLNGAGVRAKANSELYTAGLYLENKSNTAKDVLTSVGIKRLRLVMLNDISAKKLSELLIHGLITNTREEDLGAVVSEVSRVSVMLSEQGKFLPGDSIQIDSDPTRGTTISILGKGRGMPVSQSYAQPALFRILMGIWLGHQPVDTDLKNALLGQYPARVGASHRAPQEMLASSLTP